MAGSGLVVDSTSSSAGPVVQQMTLTNELLLYLAVVNMDKGIGRGY
jgi:hypothetical protein